MLLMRERPLHLACGGDDGDCKLAKDNSLETQYLLVSMGMMVVVMARLGELVAFNTAYAQWRATTIALVKPVVLVLDSLWLPPILRAHSLQSEVFVEISTWGERLLRILRHRTATRWRGAPQSAKTRKHSPKLALHVWVFADRQWLCLSTLYSLGKRRSSTRPTIDIGTKIQKRLAVVHVIRPTMLIVCHSALVTTSSRGQGSQ
jgi:hypothetical protein